MTSKTSTDMHRIPALRARRKFMLAVLAPALFAAACRSDAPEEGQRPPDAAAETMVVQTATVPLVRSVAGTVVSSNVSPLASRVMGNVVRVLVSEGDAVRTGQLLVEIDPREGQAEANRARAGSAEIESSIDAARTNVTLAQTTLRRYSTLFERRAVSAQELDEVRAKHDSARAELARLGAKRDEVSAMGQQAQTLLSYSYIRSPLDGVVTRRFADPGAQASPGMPLVTVEDARSFRVEATVPEGITLSRGDTVTMEIGGRQVLGRVANVQPGVDRTSRSALVKIALGDSAIPLRSGAYARVLLPAGSKTSLAIPAQSLVRRGQLTSVFVVDGDGIARMRLITLGENNEVLSGLDAGERIVVEPSKVIDGAKVVTSGTRVR